MQEQPANINSIFTKFEFRPIRSDEWQQAVSIENICFPPNEACDKAQIKERVEQAPELFLVAIDKATGNIAGYINGLATDEILFRDEFFLDISLHQPEGENVMLLGLEVLPAYRRQGLARTLMSEFALREKAKGRKYLTLTCHPEKVKMYEQFGFVERGESNSTWGGVAWREMFLKL